MDQLCRASTNRAFSLKSATETKSDQLVGVSEWSVLFRFSKSSLGQWINCVGKHSNGLFTKVSH